MSWLKTILGKASHTFQISAGGGPPRQIDADNWILALGDAMKQAGAAEGVERLVCEVMSNGAVIATDVSQRVRWVVLPVIEGRVAVLAEADDRSHDRSIDARPDEYTDASYDDPPTSEVTSPGSRNRRGLLRRQVTDEATLGDVVPPRSRSPGRK